MNDTHLRRPVTPAVLLSAAAGALLWAGAIQTVTWALSAF